MLTHDKYGDRNNFRPPGTNGVFKSRSCAARRAGTGGHGRKTPAAPAAGAAGQVLKPALEKIYRDYNRRELVHPDPLEFLYRYDDIRDREIAGLVASSLAYGNVKQILRAVEAALAVPGASPRGWLERSSPARIDAAFSGFKYRFTEGRKLSALMRGAKAAITDYGGLQACYLAGPGCGLELTRGFIRRICALGGDVSTLLPDPQAGSAFKRFNLYLRWLVRSDAVDPGGWKGVPASSLIVPLDTHMHHIALKLGLTARRQGDLKTALEITEGFARLSPRDPVKYDFALTRFGIRDDLDYERLSAYIKVI
ncbi:MAG: TIGR02757 family protein [Elusimicrobiaceae bacterium]|nr:TIGR02757 family protein [Elusimicrobiaceae bacterium]